VGSLRFDKVGSGGNMKPLSVLSLAHYVDEARAAFDLLAARAADCASVTLVGHSEGSLHMLSAAVALQASPRFGGFVSMAGPSRSLLETAIQQIREMHQKQGDDPAVIDPALAAFRKAMASPKGQEPDLSAIPEAKMLWMAAHDPRQAAVVHELLFADPLAAAKSYHGRALVLSAAHDMQVPRSDADRLFAALGSPAGLKQETVIAQANHVFRQEPRSAAEITPAEAMQGYVDPARPLAAGVVDAIAGFARR
jgi:pimeloyl-ACP methyl ester carboxylesterase